MTSRERINAAMRGEQPDRVPVWCLLSLEHILRHGTSDGSIPVSVEELVEAECRLTKRYHFDGSLVYLPGIPRGQKVYDLINKLVNVLPEGDRSHVLEEVDPEGWKPDIPNYQLDDFYSSHLTREILGDSHHLGGWAADGFSRAIQWFPNLEEAMMALIQDASRFKALVNYFDEETCAWARAQIEYGKLESIQISSPYAGASFISVNHYRDLVFDSVKRLTETIRSAGGFSYLHTCGYISDRLEILTQSGVDGIECMDPPPLGNVTLENAKQRVGHQIFLKGNIDSVNVLLQGDDEIVDKTIKETVEAGKPGGAFILSTACSVAPDVRPARVQRLWELAEEYGKY